MTEMLTDEQVRAHVAANLRRLLEDRGLSQSELARMTGDTQANISRICAGQHVCGAGILTRLAEALDVSMERLTGPPPKKSLAAAS